MQAGPSELDIYKTEQGALDFFVDDSIDKSQFSLVTLLRLASGNTALARSLIDLRYSSQPHSTLDPPRIFFYLSASRLAALAENEEIALEILNDRKLQDILLVRTGHTIDGKIKKEVKYLLQVALHHQSVKTRLLNNDNFLPGLVTSQLVECAKAIKEMADKVLGDPNLFTRLKEDEVIDIVSCHEQYALHFLKTKSDLSPSQIVKLSKASAHTRSTILNDQKLTSRFKREHWVEIAAGDEKLGQDILSHNWQEPLTGKELVQLSKISLKLEARILSVNGGFNARLSRDDYIEITKKNILCSQEILVKWGADLSGGQLDRLAETPAIAVQIAANPMYVERLRKYYFQQWKSETLFLERETMRTSLDSKAIGFSQIIEIGRAAFYSQIKYSAQALQGSQEEQAAKPLSAVLEKLNKMLDEPSSSTSHPTSEADKMMEWCLSFRQPPSREEDEEAQEKAQREEIASTATATRAKERPTSQ